MKPNLVLTLSAIYLVLCGLVMLLMPHVMLVSGSAGTPPTVFFALRAYGGLMLGVAIMNWIARNAEASKSQNGIYICNIVVYALSAIVFLVDVLTGGSPLLWGYIIISVVFTIAFGIVGRAKMS
jgi:hypothetical protein